MGQGSSIPAEDYKALFEQYKRLQIDYDIVNDELNDLYVDYDASRAALMKRQSRMKELGVSSCLWYLLVEEVWFWLSGAS